MILELIKIYNWIKFEINDGKCLLKEKKGIIDAKHSTQVKWKKNQHEMTGVKIKWHMIFESEFNKKITRKIKLC